MLKMMDLNLASKLFLCFVFVVITGAIIGPALYLLTDTIQKIYEICNVF